MSRNSRFTENLSSQIRKEYLAGALVKDLCKTYNTSRTTISKIIKGLAPVRKHNPNRRIYGTPRLTVIANGKELKMTKTQKFFYDVLMNSKCVDCGETNIVVLDFDHIDPSTKIKSVSHLKGCYDNIEMVKTEMAKCEVRCVKCHRIKTAIDHGWMSYHLEMARRQKVS